MTEDECRELQEESGSFNDEMLDFINSVFGHEDMINNSIILENIGYHKIGSIFKYNIGSKEVESRWLNPVMLVVKDAYLIIVRIITVRIPIVLM